MSLLYAAQIKTDDGKIGVYHDGSLNLPKRLTVVPATDVVDIAIEDGKAASKRLTAARVAAVGVLASLRPAGRAAAIAPVAALATD